MRCINDWDRRRSRHAAFWEREILDRCCCSVTVAPVGAHERIVPKTTAERLRHWTDPEVVIRRHRARLDGTYYAGDSFPQVFLDLGAAGHAGFFRGERHRFEESVWFFPSLDKPDDLAFDEDSFLYRKTLELAQALVDDSGGDYFVSMPDTSGNADALSHLMGPENLLPAMLEEPVAVQDALRKIQTAYERIISEVYDIVRDNNQGGSCIGWLDTWAPGLHAQMQADMSVMVSKAMFDAFILPELVRQCAFLAYPLYHFDGAEQVRHLDSLLSIPNLRAIQWTQVDGQPPATAYMNELKRIQSAGVGLVIMAHKQQIEPLMSGLSSKGLYLVSSADTQEEADEMVKRIGAWTRD